MGAIEVNPASGVDTNSGAWGSPVLTIGKAMALAQLASGLEGDTVILQPGVYRETITVPTGKNPVFEGRGEVYIDCESIRDAIVIPSASAANLDRAYFRNIKFINCSDYFLRSLTKTSGTFNGNLFFQNCDFYSDVSGVGRVAQLTNTYNVSLRFTECTFKRIIDVLDVNGGVAVGSGCALTLSGCTVDTTHGIARGVVGTAAVTNVTTAYDHIAYPAGVGAGNVDVTANPPPYTSATFPGPDLSLDPGGAHFALYVGAGANKGNIGSAWFALLGAVVGLPGVDIWRDAVTGQRYISDDVYEAAAGTHGALVYVDDVNGAGYEINTQKNPSATSGGLLSPVWTVKVQAGVTTSLRRLFCGARQDITGGPGANKVVDSTPGDATRTAQYRARPVTSGLINQTDASPAFTDQAMDADFTVPETTDFYAQRRDILTLIGG